MNVSSTPDAVSPIHSPRALLFFLSHQDSYRRPLFSESEIFCGPDTESREQQGRVVAIKTTPGACDVAEIIRGLPSEQHPEFVVVKADATRRNLPRNLSAVAGPKVLLVGDTHHLRRPISTLIDYARSEPFDFIIFDHTRHHARFFAEAGCRNLYWLPALDYGYMPRPLAAKPSRPLTFVGQAGKHHPYRCAVLEQVRQAGLPLAVLRGTLAQTADIYADSEVTLNVSLNGDLNLRVFEALSAGGFLLTDALSGESGFSHLFEVGRHLDTWRTPAELIEKIRHYLAHPDEARRIRQAGQEEILRHHTPAIKLREFYDLLGSGRVNPRYDLSGEPWYCRSVTVPAVDVAGRIAAHEAVQELHRRSEAVVLIGMPPERQPDFLSLPRVRVADTAAGPSDSSAGAGSQVLCWTDALANDVVLAFDGLYHLNLSGSATVADRMARWGIVPVETGSPLCGRTHPALWLDAAYEAGAHDLVRSRFADALQSIRTADEALHASNIAEALGEDDLGYQAVERAVALDRTNRTALLTQAAALLDRGQPEGVAVLLEEAARLQPLPAEIDTLRSQLAAEYSSHENLSVYYRLTARDTEQAAQPLTILVVTNLLPPQELGGYGRMIWEFAHGLRARGHTVRVLTADVPEFAKTPDAEEEGFERDVQRKLELVGTWQNGKMTLLADQGEIHRRLRDNAARVRTAVSKQRPDLVLAGNLDFLGVGVLQPALAAEVPVIHAVANGAPGYTPAEQPVGPGFRIAPCSDWNGDALRNAGYFAEMETLYPGARIDRFFRFFLPEVHMLRICYASLVLPYKGAHLLLRALLDLHRAGVDFSAEIAGDAPNPTFLADLQQLVRDHGMDAKVKFTGFLDRAGLTQLFGRSNVLVFPSLFEEPFGITQVEALAGGLVVVSSGTGGAKEIIRDGEDGLLFDPNSPGDLTEKLLSLSQEPWLMERLQRSAQARAMTFSVNAAVRKIESMAESLRSAIEASKLYLQPSEAVV